LEAFIGKANEHRNRAKILRTVKELGQFIDELRYCKIGKNMETIKNDAISGLHALMAVVHSKPGQLHQIANVTATMIACKQEHNTPEEDVAVLAVAATLEAVQNGVENGIIVGKVGGKAANKLRVVEDME
jgi:ethanolamine ammonia-lyase large subunit